LGDDVAANVAVTVFAAFIVTVQVLCLAVQPPLQPMKVLPAVAVAVRMTLAPLVNVCVQSVPQVMPVPTTWPDPVPVLITVRT